LLYFLVGASAGGCTHFFGENLAIDLKSIDRKLNAANVRPSSVAGWSSLVARQAHNLKVVGSNPTPAPNLTLL
jgi:hypothetical protein